MLQNMLEFMSGKFRSRYIFRLLSKDLFKFVDLNCSTMKSAIGRNQQMVLASSLKMFSLKNLNLVW